MSDELSQAIAEAARDDGITAGAWMRRVAMERLGLKSGRDARSNTPQRRPGPDAAALATVVRELATLSAAVSCNDVKGVHASIDRARRILIPLAIGRSVDR